MLFKQSFHDGLIDGSITETFRCWTRPRVKAGGRYRLSGAGVLEVEAVGRVPLRNLTDADARRSGFSDRRALLAELQRMAGSPLAEDAQITRVAFRYLPLADSRQELAHDDDLSGDDLAALSSRLERMDRLSNHGVWTWGTLRLIERRPQVAASFLAREAGRDKASFKTDVRKLKKLGLTISFDVGYEISPRGRTLLRRRS